MSEKGKRSGKIYLPGGVSHAWKYQGLVENIQRNLGRLPITSKELYQRVTDDYGTVNERIFYQYLQAMRKHKLLKFEETPERRGMHPAWLYSALPQACQTDAVASSHDDSPQHVLSL